MMEHLLQVDAQLTTTACSSCSDPSVCQSSGAGSGTMGTPPQGTSAGSIQIQTASGTTSIGGSGRSTSDKLVFSPNETMAKVLADCPLLGLVLLRDLRYDTSAAQIESGTTPAEAVVASLLLYCEGLKAERPLQIAAVDDASLFLPAQAAPKDLPVQLRIDMLDGPLRVNVVSDQVPLDVQTSEASVRVVGQNEFGVAFDGQTGDTTVVAYSGGVEVYSMGSGIQVAALRQGDQ